MQFFEANEFIFEVSLDLETAFYTLSFEKVKNIIEGLKKMDYDYLISDKFYDLAVNFKKKYEKFNDSDDSDVNIYKIFLELRDLQVEIIISTINLYISKKIINLDNMTYSLIKFFQDIGFCIKLFYFSINDFLLRDDFLGYDYTVDTRISNFFNLLQNLSPETKFPDNLLNLATESSRIKDTIILGDKNFRNHIKGLNLPSKRINELDDNELDSFFKNPYKEKKI